MEAPTTGQKKKKKKETQAAQLAGIVCSVLYWSVANLLINGRDKCVMADPLSLATHTHTLCIKRWQQKRKKEIPAATVRFSHLLPSINLSLTSTSRPPSPWYFQSVGVTP